MGSVYRVRDSRLGRDVAIKFLTALDDASDIPRFLREARIVAGIRHPNVGASRRRARRSASDRSKVPSAATTTVSLQ